MTIASECRPPAEGQRLGFLGSKGKKGLRVRRRGVRSGRGQIMPLAGLRCGRGEFVRAI